MTEDLLLLTNRLEEVKMKRLIYIISLLVFGLFLADVSMAGDVEDIKKATMEHFATQNAGDAKAHINLISSNCSSPCLS